MTFQKLIFTSITVVAAMVLSCRATLPTELQGSWILDEDATIAALKQSPKWDAEAEKMMPRMMKFMASMSMSFTAETMTHSVRGKQVAFTPTVVSSEKGRHVFSATHRDKTITFTATISPAGHMNLRADKSNDMDFIMWKQGTPPADAGQAEAAAVAGMMKGAIEEGLQKGLQKGRAPAAAPAPAAEAPADAYTIKWGQLRVNRLPDDAVSAINASPAAERSKVTVEKACSQKDFDRLVQIKGIKELTINDNKQIESLQPLRSLNGITVVKLTRLDALIDLAPVAALKDLETLDCMATKVTNIDALGGLAHLKTVKLFMSAVDSLEFLRTTPLVEDLNLYGFAHTFKDYAPLLALPGLKRLNIYMNKTATDELLKPLAQLATLEEISMSNSREVTTLHFLQGSSGLTRVKAAWSRKLVDISALADKSALQELDIRDSAVTDFSALQKKPNLKSLNLSGTAFADLGLLASSVDLSSLELHGSQVADITPLAAFKALRRLSIAKTIPADQVEALKQALPDLRIREK